MSDPLLNEYGMPFLRQNSSMQSRMCSCVCLTSASESLTAPFVNNFLCTSI